MLEIDDATSPNALPRRFSINESSIGLNLLSLINASSTISQSLPANAFTFFIIGQIVRKRNIAPGLIRI